MSGPRLLQTLLACVCALTGAFAADWSYSGASGPISWAVNYASCGLSRQSPVGIYKGDVKVDLNMAALTLDNYGAVISTTSFVNNGHTVQVNINDEQPILLLTGGGLNGQYRAVQFHFHWGSTDSQGSEHLIDTVQYPMEMHIVHYNIKYPNVGAAVPESDGLAVIGFMFEVAQNDNPAFNDIVSNLGNIQAEGTSVPLNPFRLESLIPTNRNFYTYPGSLTTPACQQSVSWFVLEGSVKMSPGQLEAFRTVLTSSGQAIVDNFRPVQPLNTRQVKSNFDPDVHWGYLDDDANNWYKHYEACGAPSQSPISLPSATAELDTSISQFQFLNYDATEGIQMQLSNNGHSAVITYTSGSISINGGGLPQTYHAAQFHFHWGSTSNQGSEHEIDLVAYPMELHIVHYGVSHGDLGTAANQPEGLAVLGFFFKISPEDNPALEPLISKLSFVTNPGSKYDMPETFSLDSILPTNRGDFYRYSGSLTTPGCYESVIWTVFNDPIHISENQMSVLRQLKSSEKVNNVNVPLVDNFRPVQPINMRKVKRTFEIATPHWSYEGSHGVEYWGQYFPACKDTIVSSQSPVNLVATETQYQEIESLQLSGYSSIQGVSWELSNNGHTVVANLVSGDFSIASGGLSGVYKAAQFHFHWGASSAIGSEHLINSKAYPLELHIVHYGAGFQSLSEAARQPNGLAVLGFMFEVSDTDNAALAPIVDSLRNVITPGQKFTLPAMTLRNILPASLDNFYRYSGSLTTPGCYESVMWTVFRNSIPISEAQLEKFRVLLSSDFREGTTERKVLVNNYRPVQPINQRVVTANFKLDPDSSTSLRASLVLSALSVLLGLIRWNL